jgi:hypothetical protein
MRSSTALAIWVVIAGGTIVLGLVLLLNNGGY